MRIAILLNCVGGAFCFAPYARVSFSNRRKRNQKGLPQPWVSAALRLPSLRRCSRGRRDGPSLAHHAFRGSRPLNPLRNDSTRPALTGRVDQDQVPDQHQKLEAESDGRPPLPQGPSCLWERLQPRFLQTVIPLAPQQQLYLVDSRTNLVPSPTAARTPTATRSHPFAATPITLKNDKEIR
jgi:hypothetical protein